MSWDHNCNHLRMARIFTRCPVCECILNSTQGMGQRDDRAASKPAVFDPFHNLNNTQPEARDHV